MNSNVPRRNRASGRLLLRLLGSSGIKHALVLGVRAYYRRALVGFVFYLLLLWRASRNAIAKKNGTLESETEQLGAWRKFVRSHSSLVAYLLASSTKVATNVAFILQLLTTHAASAPVYAANFVSQQTLSLQEVVQNRVEIWLEEQLDTVGEKVKSMIQDPYMPSELLSMIDDTVDVVLPDIKLALLMKTDEYIKYRSPVTWYLEGAPNTTTSELHESWSQSASNWVASVPELVSNTWLVQKMPNLPTLPWPFVPAAAPTADSTAEAKDVSKTVSFADVAPEPEAAGDDVDLLLDEFNQDSPSLVNETGNGVSSRWRMWRVTAKLKRSALELKNAIWNTRAFVLYTLSPYDKSFWQNAREPRFIVLQAIGLVPKFGIVWWLVVFLMQDKRDEYGMCQFIVGFQTAKFFSQGCLSLLYGSLLFFTCANQDVATCETSGPKVSDYFDAMGFMLQILLVWVSFFILPYTTPCHATANDDVELSSDGKSNRYESMSVRSSKYRKPSARNAQLQEKVTQTRANRLAMLFWWDTCSVVLVFALAALTIVRYPRQQDWQLRTTLYWLRTLYGLLSIPFVLFKLPLLGNLLTPSKPTGYHQTGKVVLRGHGEPLPSTQKPAPPNTWKDPSQYEVEQDIKLNLVSPVDAKVKELELELEERLGKSIAVASKGRASMEQNSCKVQDEKNTANTTDQLVPEFVERSNLLESGSTGSSTSVQSMESEPSPNRRSTGSSLWQRRQQRNKAHHVDTPKLKHM